MNGRIDKTNRIVWQACERFRGVIDPGRYNNHLLAMLFLKYASDSHESQSDAGRRFIVPDNSRFGYLLEHCDDKDIDLLTDRAFDSLVSANPDRLGGEEGVGLFDGIRFCNPLLGSAGERTARLRRLLYDLSDERLRFGGAEAGSVCSYLIERFACDAGKKPEDFYTPDYVSALLVRLVKSAPHARICDPACGSGSLLIKAAEESGGDVGLYGQELNVSTWAMARLNMLMHGRDNAVIRRGDTLRDPKLTDGDMLMKFDTVLANPPFSLDKWGADRAENDIYGRFRRGVPPVNRGDWAFISHMIESACDGSGRVAVVVPHGVLFRGSVEGAIRRRTIEENLVEAVIGLPANLFFGTSIPAAIMIFNKGKKCSEVLFVDASRESGSGRSHSHLRSCDIDHIVSTYERFAAGRTCAGEVEKRYAYVATRDEISANGFNLDISCYVDSAEQEPAKDISVMTAELAEMKKALADVRAELKKYMDMMGLDSLLMQQ